MTTAPATAPGVRRQVRNIIVAGASLVALAAAALFLIAPSSSALSVTSKVTGSAAHGTEVIYGKFTDSSGNPVTGAKLAVSHVVSEVVGNSHKKHVVQRTVVVARATSNAKGIYRTPAHFPAGTYQVTLSERIRGKVFSADKTVSFEPGKTYQISATIKDHSLFSFLPISTY